MANALNCNKSNGQRGQCDVAGIMLLNCITINLIEWTLTSGSFCLLFSDYARRKGFSGCQDIGSADKTFITLTDIPFNAP